MQQDFYLDPFLTSDTSTSINYFDLECIISSWISIFHIRTRLLLSFPLAESPEGKGKIKKKKSNDVGSGQVDSVILF